MISGVEWKLPNAREKLSEAQRGLQRWETYRQQIEPQPKEYETPQEIPDSIKNANAQIVVFADRVKKAKAAVEALERDKATCEEYRRFWEESLEWCSRLREVFGELRQDGRIDFRIYTEVAGREIELARSEGFVVDAASGASRR